MNKITSLLLLFLLLSLEAIAQQKITITGTVIDTNTKQELPFVTIAIKDINNSILTGAISNDYGDFEISNLEVGNYNIEFSFVGYQTLSQKIVAGGLNTNFYLGKIALVPSQEALSEVTVIAQKSALNTNLSKKSFKLKDNVAQSGGSVLDAMKTLPGVAFDQDGKVVLRGSDKVIILINGKQSSLTGFGNQKGLGTIPASNIENIEIINNPSAKYDANGFAGIINLIYKKEKQTGFNGEVGLTSGTGVFTKRRDDTPTELGSFSLNPKLIPSVNLNYRTKQLNYFLTSEFILQEGLPNNEFTTRNFDNGRNLVSQVPENRRQFRSIINGGVDWEIDNKNSITISGLYDREKHIDTSHVAFINQNNNLRERLYTWREEEVTRFINVAAKYKHKFKQQGHSLSGYVLYSQGLEDETYSLNDSSAVRIGRDKTNILAVENNVSISTDYAKPLKNGKIETGLKFNYRDLPVEYTITPGENSILFEGIGSFSNWNEEIYAGYGNYVLEKEHFDIEAGVRAEYTKVLYEVDPNNTFYDRNDAYDYFELFPNIRFTYKLNGSNKFSAFFNRRIDRPGEPELRVFPKFDDPELLKVGNPYSRPQLTNKFEIAHKYSWQKGYLYTSFYIGLIENQFLRILNTDTSNPNFDIVNKIYQNIGNANNSGIELLFSQSITQYWKLSANANFFTNRIDDFEGELLFPFRRNFRINKSRENAGDFKLNNQLELPLGINFQITGLYNSERNVPQGKRFERSSIDIGAKKKAFNNKGEFTLSFSDIFNRFGIKERIRTEGLTTLYENYFETQVLRIGFNYKF